MKKFLNSRILGLSLLMVAVMSCDMLETAEQDVSPVTDPGNNPTVTFTPSTTGTSFTEGNKLIYVIKTNKMIDRALTFTAVQVGGTANENDFTASTVVLQPYSTEVKMEIEFVMDDYPENEETLQLEIGVFGIAERYLLNPSSLNPIKVDLKVVNKNDPDKLTIAMEWTDHSADFDFVTWSDTPDYPLTEWGDGGATANNPEIDKSIWLSDPAGTYYVNIMDWDAGPFNYKFSIGHPSGTVQFIEGVFDRSKTNYTVDNWTAWGDSYPSYRVLKVVNSGTSFTVTKL